MDLEVEKNASTEAVVGGGRNVFCRSRQCKVITQLKIDAT